ncbi:MAG: hypothetical protein U1E30_04635 [Rhodoblastus sp.]
MRFVLEADRELREATGRALVGPGYLRLEDPDHEPLFFDDFRRISMGRRKPADCRQPYPVLRRRNAIRVRKARCCTPPRSRMTAGKSRSVSPSLGSIAAERPDEKILAMDKASIEGLRFSTKKCFDIAASNWSAPGGAQPRRATLRLGERPAYPSRRLDRLMPLRALFRVWPSMMGAPARTWLIGHANAGTIESAKLSIDFDKNALTAMVLDRPPPDNPCKWNFS